MVKLGEKLHPVKFLFFSFAPYLYQFSKLLPSTHYANYTVPLRSWPNMQITPRVDNGYANYTLGVIFIPVGHDLRGIGTVC